MDEEDFAELLRHLRSELQAAGFQELDDEVRAASPPDDITARDLILLYLDALETRMALTSGHTVARTIEVLNEHVLTEDNLGIDDVQLLLDPAARLSTRVEAISLAELPDQRRQIAALRRLRSELLES